MVEAAGGSDILGRPGRPSFPTTWDAVRRLEPELVVLAPCGFDVERTAAEAGRADLPNLSCQVVAVDANSYFSRPAPRVADGVRQLAHLFHPDDFADPGLPSLELTQSIVGRERARR
jgi:iron complex transport system substrate-binding protein